MISAFTTADSPELRRLVQEDLDLMAERLLGEAPGATLLLGGGFAFGEGVAWLRDGRLVSLSDYDLFLVLPSALGVARLASVRRAVQELAPRLHNPRLDLNLQLPGLLGGAWQPRVPMPVIGGPALELAPPDPSMRLGFAMHALHGGQLELLACEPSLAADPLTWRYRVNRCALVALRAAWNLESPEPVYSFGACREPLESAWGEGLEAPLRAMLLEALEQNPGLGLASLELPAPDLARWSLARLALELLHERWAWQRAGADAAGRRALLRERVKGLPRLVGASLRSGRLPGPVVDAHPLLFEARRSLLEAVIEGGIDVSWLERAQRRLGRLGIGPRRWPRDPREAWRLAREATAVPNPARVVVGLD
jgi:hypothetical protein